MALSSPVRDAHVLVIAGSDPTGGAGLARDIETVAAFGLRAAITVTALTVQTHRQVSRVEPTPAALVAAQMKAAFEAAPIGAVKIGMLATRQTIEAVASVLEAHGDVPAVLDPVLAATSGGSLLNADAVAALKTRLMPLCALITPNRPELGVLTGSPPAADEDTALRQGETLLAEGAGAVLVKGGHAAGDRAMDFLLQSAHAAIRFDAPRLNVRMRGTGCMLASAVAAGLASGRGLEESVRTAKGWMHARLLGVGDTGEWSDKGQTG